MAVVTIKQLKLETEGDLQVLNFRTSATSDGDTFSTNSYFGQIENIQATPATSAAVPIGVTTPSSGVVTFKMGTASAVGVWVRIAGN